MTFTIRTLPPGPQHFFTVRLALRGGTSLTDHVAHLRRATRLAQGRHPFRIDAIAVLPDTIHTIWTLPPEDTDFGIRWRMIKGLFSRALPAPEGRSETQLRRGDKGIWQRGYWSHRLRDAADVRAHRQMIYASPVQAGLCAVPRDWPHSSIHRDLRLGRAAITPDHDHPMAHRLPKASQLFGAAGLSH
ncbi:REP-associated tyrosine transposase [Sulfitobacter sp. S190]|uniref:REP-associated tyrosine transposase n=1 Tax=Sulfitobacter sp. S190 TaxID=2867022 RepID=UPI0021A2F9FB|nr:transposase [Sulfitobacter sp. S190]UWR23652.1 transposase [Sulfitobacter sp. S190]